MLVKNKIILHIEFQTGNLDFLILIVYKIKVYPNLLLYIKLKIFIKHLTCIRSPKR